MKQCSCGKPAEGSTLCLILYDEKKKMENGEEKHSTEVLGATETFCCKSCLAHHARKNIGFSILGFIGGVLVIFLLCWLISKVFHLSWVGGGLLSLMILWNLIKELATTVKKTQMNGSASILTEKYKKQGYIPVSDLLWVTDVGQSFMSDDGRLALQKTETFDPEEMMIITQWALEDSIHSLPENDIYRQKMQDALDESCNRASADVLPEPQKIRKELYMPLPAFLLIVVTLVWPPFIFMEGFDVHDPFFFVTGAAMFILGVGGAILLVWKRNALWYLFIVAAVAVFWVASYHMLGADVYQSPETHIISFSYIVVMLCWLPYCKKKTEEGNEL